MPQLVKLASHRHNFAGTGKFAAQCKFFSFSHLHQRHLVDRYSTIFVISSIISRSYAASSGDSYTDVGFKITTAQDISAEYNKSLIYLYDFAHSGAIVNSSLISPYQSVNNTFTAQADNQFLAYLTGEDRIVNWHSSDSLFTVFFGINDIDRALGVLTDWDERLPLIQDSYWAHVEKLYNAGARNFAFLNLPTYWLSPGIINRGNATVVDVARHRNLLWNHELAKRFEHFQCTHRSTFAKLVDVYGLWESMYAYPAAYGLSNVT
ncbi:hypothetical protein D0860_05021 [Hortaea werneckii]|uniref:SGNH hydrolase-type esterase domain-containing protein n=1 Tax=Hortaea werneckii TaxID=91943 RepID=A0A3M7H2F8_HORWE|nr:hypothetical protein D0860_05021 [Hortaea werneckii]